MCSCVWLEAKIKSQGVVSILLNSSSICVFVYSVIPLSEKRLILNATKNVPKITFGMSLFHVKIRGQKSTGFRKSYAIPPLCNHNELKQVK